MKSRALILFLVLGLANSFAQESKGSSQTGRVPGGSSQTGSQPGGSSQTGRVPGGSSQTGRVPGGSSQTGSQPGGSSQTGRVPGGSSQTGSQPGGSSQTGRAPGGSSQTRKAPGGSSQTGSNRPNYNSGSNKPNYNTASQIGGVGAPAYLSIPGFENCLEEFTPAGGDHSENCLPNKRPYNCAEQAWEELQNVFEGDCPHSPSQTGSHIGGVGAPAYLSVPGFEQCLEEFTPAVGQHSENCLPNKRPYNCAERAWEELQNVFEGDCPHSSSQTGSNLGVVGTSNGGQLGGSTQTGRVPGGSSQTGSNRPNYNTGSNKPNYNTGSQIGGVGAPAYLSIPGFEHCLEEFTPVGALHSENCLPHRKPYYCAERAWEEIQNVFEGDCPYAGSHIGGVGAPAYLSIPGFEQCLEEFIPVGADHSENCLPHKKPYNCNQRAWEELQNVFEGKCPHSSPVTDLKTLFECEKDFDCPLNIPHCNRMLSPTPSGKMGYCVPSRCQNKVCLTIGDECGDGSLSGRCNNLNICEYNPVLALANCGYADSQSRPNYNTESNRPNYNTGSNVKPDYTNFRQRVPTSTTGNPAPNCQCFCEDSTSNTGDYNNDDQFDDEVEYENDDAELSRPNYNTGFGFEVNPRLTQSNKQTGFGFRRTTFLTSAAETPSERPLFVKKSTKPAPPAERPSVLGPTFVGLDFLTRPDPKTGGAPRQNNGFSTKPAPIAERPAVLGPTFVGLDFLTRPAPKTGGDPRQNNGFSTKPAPTADRPAVLGPTFVGLDFLTRPVPPSNNAKSPRKNDDFTGDSLFY